MKDAFILMEANKKIPSITTVEKMLSGRAKSDVANSYDLSRELEKRGVKKSRRKQGPTVGTQPGVSKGVHAYGYSPESIKGGGNYGSQSGIVKADSDPVKQHRTKMAYPGLSKKEINKVMSASEEERTNKANERSGQYKSKQYDEKYQFTSIPDQSSKLKVVGKTIASYAKQYAISALVAGGIVGAVYLYKKYKKNAELKAKQAPKGKKDIVRKSIEKKGAKKAIQILGKAKGKAKTSKEKNLINKRILKYNKKIK